MDMISSRGIQSCNDSTTCMDRWPVDTRVANPVPSRWDGESVGSGICIQMNKREWEAGQPTLTQ
jgi:hypothetical protein